jgi:predicted O-methyltransferase YrrM
MPSISIITPWHGETGPSLLPEYFQAIQGAHIVTVDNACPHVTAGALVEMTAHMGGEYIRNEANAGFAAANNQGYAAAKGDIIIFLNSDVAPTGPWLAQVAADVRDGALYGPSLQAQMVAGQHIPYIEGWCIAATRATWDKIITAWNCEHRMGYGEFADETMLWDEVHFPGPYWEDNELCLRALQYDIPLIQTQWSIAHKGGQTAGPIMRHARSFAENEYTFTQRALAILKQPDMTETWQRYMQAYHTQSDIQHHVGLLYSLARGNVVELGTRTGVSTAALLAGVEARGGHVWSVDVDPTSASVAAGHPQWTFICADSRDVSSVLTGIEENTEDFDLILVDTLHTHEHVTEELSAWAKYLRPGAHICIHDPETFPGVRRAVREFCAARGWPVTFVLPCNGMAVIEVPNA